MVFGKTRENEEIEIKQDVDSIFEHGKGNS